MYFCSVFAVPVFRRCCSSSLLSVPARHLAVTYLTPIDVVSMQTTREGAGVEGLS